MGWSNGQPLEDCTWPASLVAGVAMLAVVGIGVVLVAAAIVIGG